MTPAEAKIAMDEVMTKLFNSLKDYPGRDHMIETARVFGIEP